MQGQNTFVAVAGGVFVGGILLVLAVAFWQAALILALIIGVIAALVFSPLFRAIAFLGVLAVAAYSWYNWLDKQRSAKAEARAEEARILRRAELIASYRQCVDNPTSMAEHCIRLRERAWRNPSP